MQMSTQVITIGAAKGGVGKTTITFNTAGFLNKIGKSVLLMDGDYQGSLSSIYGKFDKSIDGTMYSIFDPHDGPVKIRKITDKLSIIPASKDLERVDIITSNRPNQYFILYEWISNNMDIVGKFDYVLIDTHPQFLTMEKNAAVISDYLIQPLGPGRFDFNNAIVDYTERFNEFKKQLVDVKTGESYVDAQLLYLGNRAKTNTTSSHEFDESLKEIPDVIDLMHEREPMNQSILLGKSVFEMDDLPNTAMAEFERVFSNIVSKVEE